ncbi:hypothetical protein AB1Y20_014503 [Prymnesium parvum]|uniref:Protein phosphatase 1 regulatory subunit 11 n=1 Tax=Prymnesium parvum TaxID=97485 RepID=A0AB34IE69_PRYPA
MYLYSKSTETFGSNSTLPCPFYFPLLLSFFFLFSPFPRLPPMGTSTLTVTASQPQQVTLRLRSKRRVRWSSDVVDNEELCRKKSKCCCVYHPPRNADQPSEDEDDGFILPEEMRVASDEALPEGS